MKEKLEKVQEHLRKASIVAVKVSIFFVAMIVGFISNEAYRNFTGKSKTSMPSTKGHKETSVAINEKDEVIIFSRIDGTYDIYSDTVGRMIFNHYASKMYYKATGKE